MPLKLLSIKHVDEAALEEVVSEEYATEWDAAGHVRTLKP